VSQLRRALLYLALGFLLGQITLPLVALIASAQDYLVTTVTSFHFDRNKDYNEKNLGLGIERRFSETWSASTGYFRNSFNRDTVYVFAGYTPIEVYGWRVGMVGGAVSGYDRRITPWLTGLIMRDFGRVGVNIVAAPAGLALQLKWAL
jgi:tetrahydromethanopterin S-methyltransferase subunit B